MAIHGCKLQRSNGSTQLVRTSWSRFEDDPSVAHTRELPSRDSLLLGGQNAGERLLKSVSIIGTRGYPSYYGGFETAVRKLAPYLVEHGWDVTVYGRHGSTNDADLNRDLRVRSVVTRGVETKSLSTLSYGLTAVLDAFRRKPRVVLVMNVANGYWLPILKLRGIPTAVNVDGIEWDRAKWNVLAKSVFHLGARLTARFGDQMIYDAEAIGARWRDEFGVAGTFIPYGGDSREPLQIEPGLIHRGYALLVARFVPENTVPEFVEAAATIAQSYPVVIVGSSGYGGELDDAVQQLASVNSNVRWLGHVSDDDRLLSLWQHAGAYFHGHSVGGTNPALVQAMACGAPIIARDTIYNREVLEDAGLLVSPNAPQIAATMISLLSDPLRQDDLSSRAERRAQSRYTWELVCAAYERTLSALIEEPRKSARQRSRTK
jgi:glycosyltransferase involved in cell wall biosynthesis